VKETFNHWFKGLSRTRQNTFDQIKSFLHSNEITTETWDKIESLLIQSDVGVETSQAIIDHLKTEIKTQGIKTEDGFRKALKSELLNRLLPARDINFSGFSPAVIMIVGANGSGKTTTIAKLANYYKLKGKDILLAAGDTFRAAANDQLQIWADRIGVSIITGEPGSDPGAVVYNSIQAGIARKKDLIIIDTAGRLHTRFNLMEELKKVYRVAGKALEGAPHACWLVIDAITGQNALIQAQYFKEAVNVNGIILAKLDLSAHGGMAFAIQERLALPILFSGFGEEINDLQPFSAEFFVESLLSA
jgi:fused signal recognition particle receptor